MALATLWAARAPAQRTPAPQPDVQTITDEMIRRAGLVRLGDIVRLLDGWHSSSLDGFNQQVYPLGTLPGMQPWTLWLNGHRVYMGGWSLQQLNRLPVPLEDIDYIEVSTAPRFIGGVPVTGGVIHVHTHIPREGVSVRAGYWIGNESGDPGPFVFLSDDGPNVDRLGPEVEASLAYRSSFRARAGGITRINYPTDPAVAPRLRPFISEHPKRRMAGINLQLHHSAGFGENDVWIGLTGMEDFVYLRPFSREIPAFTLFGQAGLRGYWALDPTWSVRYRGAWATNGMESRDDALMVDPDRRIDRINANVSLQYQSEFTFLGGGLMLDRSEALLKSTPGDADRTTRGAFLRYQRTGLYGIQPSAALQARYDGNEWAYHARLGAYWRVRPIHTFSGTLAYTERFFGDVYGRWYWTRRGASLLDSLGVPYSFVNSPEKTRIVTADARWRLRPTQLLQGSLGAFYNYYPDATLERRNLFPVEDGDIFEGPVSIVSGASGQVAGGYLSVSYRWQPWLTQRLLYQLQKNVASDEDFRLLQKAQTSFLARTRFTYTPEQSFAMDFTFEYRAPTDWFAYGGAGDLPSFFRMDVAVAKWFWDQRLRGQLVVRNVLNTPYRTHPIGPTFPLTLLVRFGLRI